MSNFKDELTQLRAENKSLKELLTSHGINYPVPNENKTAESNHHSDSEQLNPTEKIKLFRSLFRGRDDVYPIRWESGQSGKTGYSPVCANEWRKGICEKPRIKCGDCNHGLYVPVTDFVISQHLQGKITAGIYPLLKDDRCYFLAIDFDDGEWRKDAKAVLRTSLENNLPAVLEISRSGEGAHLWLFFASAVPISLLNLLAVECRYPIFLILPNDRFCASAFYPRQELLCTLNCFRFLGT
jgi:hypothetical protein